MSTPSAKLAELGIELPPVAAPVAAYVPAVRIGDHVWTSGQLPFVAGQLACTGKVGQGVSEDDAARAAEVCALNGLAAAAAVAGGIDKISRVVKVVVYVASAPDFTAQPKVANGASDLIKAIFGEAGQHVRTAVGMAVLPLDAAVEVELVVEVSA